MDACCRANKIPQKHGSFANLKATQDPSSSQVIRFMTFFSSPVEGHYITLEHLLQKAVTKEIAPVEIFHHNRLGDF